VGIAVSESDSDTAGLLQRADVARYEAKTSGTGRYAQSVS
jgi:GGDEF domain-containing protein